MVNSVIIIIKKQKRLERRPEKNLTERTPVGKNVQEIWVGTKAQAPSPSYNSLINHRYNSKALQKMKSEQPPTLPDWMHGMVLAKERTEQKKKLNETKGKNAVGSEA